MATRGATRLRGRALQDRRRAWFNRHPLCAACSSKGKVTAAAELDHIIPLHQGGDDTEDNWQSLCAACHYEKSKRERGHSYRPRIGLDGFPENQ